MDAAFNLRKMFDSGDGRNLEIAKVTRQDQDTLARLKRLDHSVHTFDTDD